MHTRTRTLHDSRLLVSRAGLSDDDSDLDVQPVVKQPEPTPFGRTSSSLMCLSRPRGFVPIDGAHFPPPCLTRGSRAASFEDRDALASAYLERALAEGARACLARTTQRRSAHDAPSQRFCYAPLRPASPACSGGPTIIAIDALPLTQLRARAAVHAHVLLAAPAWQCWRLRRRRGGAPGCGWGPKCCWLDQLLRFARHS